jgi:hypothetical protein
VYALSPRLSGAPYGIGLLLVLAPFALLLAVPVLQTYSAKRALTSFPDFRSLTYAFDDSGFTLQTSQTKLHIKWDAVRYAAACEGLLILILQSNFAYYVPDRVLPPGPVREQLGALIDRHVLGGLHKC